MKWCFAPVLIACFLATYNPIAAFDEELNLHNFSAKQLTDIYYAEGINIGDLNTDGANDVVYGPF